MRAEKAAQVSAAGEGRGQGGLPRKQMPSLRAPKPPSSHLLAAQPLPALGGSDQLREI